MYIHTYTYISTFGYTNIYMKKTGRKYTKMLTAYISFRNKIMCSFIFFFLFLMLYHIYINFLTKGKSPNFF